MLAERILDRSGVSFVGIGKCDGQLVIHVGAQEAVVRDADIEGLDTPVLQFQADPYSAF